MSLHTFIQQLLQILEKEGIPSSAVLFSVLLFILMVIALSFGVGYGLARLSLSRQTGQKVKDALKRSRAVLGGLAGEQVAPFLPNFPCNSADVRFVGKPVDFIGFPGAAEDKPIEEILLIEVKTGTSQLSEREKEIRSCVEKGRIRYIEYRL